MKKTLTGLLLIAIANTSYAEINYEYCQDTLFLAQGIMEARQGDVSLVNMLNLADNAENSNEFIRTLIIKAYSQYRYDTKAEQNKAVVDYGNYIYLTCLKSYK